MNIKTWALGKLSKYYFQIINCQDKANRAANILLQYLQQNIEKKTTQVKNFKILYCLQLSLVKMIRLTIKVFSPLYIVFICETTILSQLCQFWDTI